MKLRLSLFLRDLSQRLEMFGGLCNFSFMDRRYPITEYFQSFVYMTDLETISNRTKKAFIETSRSLEMQSAT